MPSVGQVLQIEAKWIKPAGVLSKLVGMWVAGIERVCGETPNTNLVRRTVKMTCHLLRDSRARPFSYVIHSSQSPYKQGLSFFRWQHRLRRVTGHAQSHSASKWQNQNSSPDPSHLKVCILSNRPNCGNLKDSREVYENSKVRDHKTQRGGSRGQFHQVSLFWISPRNTGYSGVFLSYTIWIHAV